MGLSQSLHQVAILGNHFSTRHQLLQWVRRLHILRHQSCRPLGDQLRNTRSRSCPLLRRFCSFLVHPPHVLLVEALLPQILRPQVGHVGLPLKGLLLLVFAELADPRIRLPSLCQGLLDLLHHLLSRVHGDHSRLASCWMHPSRRGSLRQGLLVVALLAPLCTLPGRPGTPPVRVPMMTIISAVVTPTFLVGVVVCLLPFLLAPGHVPQARPEDRTRSVVLQERSELPRSQLLSCLEAGSSLGTASPGLPMPRR